MEFNFDTEALVPMLTDWGIKIILALLIYIVGKWIAKRITGFVRKLMNRADMDETLITFLSNIVYAILLAAVILAALDKLGVPDIKMCATLPYAVVGEQELEYTIRNGAATADHLEQYLEPGEDIT